MPSSLRLGLAVSASLGIACTLAVPAWADDKSKASPTTSCDTAALEARVTALEALIARLESRLDPKPDLPVEAEAPHDVQTLANETESTTRGATRRLSNRLDYLPSRGWQAAWSEPSGIAPTLRAYVDSELIDEGANGARDGASTFDNHHVQVFLDARLSPRFTAHAELEWEHSGDTVEVDQAYGSWHVADEALRLDFGRFYTPFGIERWVWYSPTNTLVSRPEVFRQVVPNNFYANGVRAAGAVGAGERGVFTWEAAVSNGLGDTALDSRRGSRRTRDDNDNKAVSSRIGWAWWPWVEIGASAHSQRYTADDATFEGAAVDDDLLFLGVDFAARWQGYEVRSEWVEATFERSALGLDDLEQDGGYLQASYTWEWDRDLLPSLTAATRLDTWSLDTDSPTGGRSGVSLALNAALHHRFRLKAEHQWKSEEGPSLDNDRWLFQAVVDF